jgi:hypothetical protein
MEKNEGLPLALCGAKAKRTGKKCSQPAMKNGRCRLHGGKSTGPKIHLRKKRTTSMDTEKKTLKRILEIGRLNIKSVRELR